MKNKEDLKTSIQRIDRKSYGMYKTLAGSYLYGDYILHIDHVQGDPFASPSRMRVEIPEGKHGFPEEYYRDKHRRIAAEDRILRVFHACLRASDSHAGRDAGNGREASLRGTVGHEAYRRETAGREASRRETAGHEASRRGTAGREASRRETAGREAYEQEAGTDRRGRRSAPGGSGKSGRITTCPIGQTVSERIAVHFTGDTLEFRFELGFPARGRTILGREMTELVCSMIPSMIRRSFFYREWTKKDRDMMEEAVKLADDQLFIRGELTKRGLIAFVADGSKLPRESGVSDRPMKNCIPFRSPESMMVEMDLPHRGRLKGMGIPEGITVIVGGGYHGKSTLLKALEQGVYNHIAGDGREYVISRDHAMKIRAEDGRSVKHSDISLFIRNLPNGQDTCDFSTENASGSTSQAANLVEAIDAGSKLLLLDEDTSATNFMIRDQVMARLVSDEKEPISTLLKHIKGLSCRMGISFVIVIGSSGDYLSVADHVLQMDSYRVMDVTQEAGRICRDAGLENAYPETPVTYDKDRRVLAPAGNYSKGSDRRMKMKAMGTDTVMIDRESVDVRYLEQLSENGQTVCLAYLMGEILRTTKRETAIKDLMDSLYERIEEEGLVSVIPRGYFCGHPVYVRKQEMYACLNRYRKARIERERA